MPFSILLFISYLGIISYISPSPQGSHHLQAPPQLPFSDTMPPQPLLTWPVSYGQPVCPCEVSGSTVLPPPPVHHIWIFPQGWAQAALKEALYPMCLPCTCMVLIGSASLNFALRTSPPVLALLKVPVSAQRIFFPPKSTVLHGGSNHGLCQPPMCVLIPCESTGPRYVSFPPSKN